MKILRKNNNFKKVPDSNIVDVVAIKGFIEQGWKFCSRKEYKDFFCTSKEPKTEEIKTEEIIQPEKKKKHGKNK